MLKGDYPGYLSSLELKLILYLGRTSKDIDHMWFNDDMIKVW